MAQCKSCGKKGFLLKLDRNGLCGKCAEREFQKTVKQEMMDNDSSYAKLSKELEHQDKLLKTVLKAREDYAQDGDIQKAIEVLEQAIVKEKPPLLNAEGHTVFLINLYKKAGLNDRAWGLLNDCILDPGRYGERRRLSQEKIHLEMAKILKSEKRYSYAIEMYMASHLYRAQWTEFDEERFQKDIRVCISKLKWDESIEQDIVTILKNCISSGEKSYIARIKLSDQYRAYLDEKKLI